MGTPSFPPPILLDPLIREKPWGGGWLLTHLGKKAPGGAPIGESWEAASLGGVSNPIREGPGAGGNLRDLLRSEGPAILGTESAAGDLPLLFKYIHAGDDLSLQVHPGEAVALRHTGRREGKAEAWRVLRADPGATIRLGLAPGIGRAGLEEALRRGEALDCLPTFPARPGDTYLIPPGCIHTVGGGVLLAEIQQPSDITYRFTDWGRSGGEGDPRPVDPERAWEAVDLSLRGPFLWEPSEVTAAGGIRRERFAGSFFSHDAFEGDGTWEGERAGGFEIVSVARGEAEVETDGGKASLRLGETALLPKGRAPLLLRMRGALVLRFFLP